MVLLPRVVASFNRGRGSRGRTISRSRSGKSLFTRTTSVRVMSVWQSEGMRRSRRYIPWKWRPGWCSESRGILSCDYIVCGLNSRTLEAVVRVEAHSCQQTGQRGTRCSSDDVTRSEGGRVAPHNRDCSQLESHTDRWDVVLSEKVTKCGCGLAHAFGKLLIQGLVSVQLRVGNWTYAGALPYPPWLLYMLAGESRGELYREVVESCAAQP